MCLFCEIIDGKIPSTKVYEDDMILAFKDINPVHIDCANGGNEENSKYVAHIFEKIPEIAKSQGIDSYRIINNCGEDAGQSVMHLHFHLIGGIKLGEKII